MSKLSDLIDDLDAVTRAARVDKEMLFRRLVARAEGIHVPPRSPAPSHPVSDEETHARIQLMTAAPFARALVLTVSLAEAVIALDSDERLVNILLENGGLQGVNIDGRLHIPEWQFDWSSPSGLLPGLGMILTAAEGRFTWIELAIFMQTPQPGLLGLGDLNIVEWLHQCHPIGPVLDIVHANRADG